MNPTFEKNITKFADLMIDKINTISGNWQKPWFSNSNKLFVPCNISGRNYTGGNIITLFLLCEKENYKIPVFLTFKQAQDENIHILKGSQSFPIYYVLYSAVDKETGERIKIEDYKHLTEQEKANYKIVGSTQFYLVFNIEQTNFSEAYPERWQKMRTLYTPKNNPVDESLYYNPTLSNMIVNQSWICNITIKESTKAFYAPIQDYIFLPLKEQFKNGESFYATLLHEMAHSTGTESRLNRKNFGSSDTKNYGREELVAELTAALVALMFGISSTIREENALYLKNWCEIIKEDSKFLLTVLTDSVKASKYICEKLNVSFTMQEENPEKQVC